MFFHACVTVPLPSAPRPPSTTRSGAARDSALRVEHNAVPSLYPRRGRAPGLRSGRHRSRSGSPSNRAPRRLGHRLYDEDGPDVLVRRTLPTSTSRSAYHGGRITVIARAHPRLEADRPVARQPPTARTPAVGRRSAMSLAEPCKHTPLQSPSMSAGSCSAASHRRSTSASTLLTTGPLVLHDLARQESAWRPSTVRGDGG